MSSELETYNGDPETRLIHLVGTDRLPGALQPAAARTTRPVILREIVERPDGTRTTREVEFPEGW